MAEEKCSNCRRFIPSASFQLHVVHCSRNMVLCSLCDEPVPRAEIEEHMAECEYRKVECVCGRMIEAGKLDAHKANECPKRSTLCKWCATHVEMGNLVEHEDYCGSRTEKCEKCGEFIMLKNFEAHLQTNCGPKPSWERKSSVVSSTPSYSSYTSSVKPSTIADSTPSISTPSYDAYSRRYSSSTISAASALRRSSSISRVTSSSLSRSATAAEVVTHNSVTEHDSSDDVVMIPCEFCHKPISSTKLLSHQAECVNPTNVRSAASTSTSNSSSSTAYTSRFTRASSISRSTSYSLTSTNSSSKINNHVQQTETANGTLDSSSVNSRKTLPTSSSSSIVNRFLNSPESKTNGSSRKYLPESPPSYEKDSGSSSYVGRSSYLMEESRRKSPPSYEKDTGSSSYVGRSSYLVEESRRENKSSLSSYKSTETKTREKTEAPGLYTNDNDREGLRQMLSSMRRDPMDVEDDPDNNDGSFFPCEFCGDPYPCEFLMRHQISCDLNPQPVSSGSGFDYNAIKRSIGDHLGVPEPSYNRRTTSATSTGCSSSSNGDGDQHTSSRESRRLSRSNSVIERSYSRSNVRASSVSRTSSFADRSYGTRTNLARQSSFTLQDYSSAARRSSIFDGVAGYSIYSSISEGLDQITYGGRGSSRRNSITESSTNYSLSRQGSFSTRNSQVPISALMASMEANKVSKDENTAIANNHINSQANAYLQNGHTNGFSRQNSRNNKADDSPFGATNGHHSNVDIQRSESNHLRRRSSLKHSDSSYKLSKQVSFHHRDQIIGDTENGAAVEGEKKEKKKRTKEEKEARRKEKEEKRARKEAKRAAREMSVDRRNDVPAPVVKNHIQGEALLEQVSYKLANLQSPAGDEGGAGTSRGCGTSLPPPPASSLLPDYNVMQAAQASRKLSSAPNTASVTANQGKISTTTYNNANGTHEDNGHNNEVANKQLIVKSETNSDSKPRKGPAPQPPVVHDLVSLDESTSSSSVVFREHNEDRSSSRSCSNRNSLDNKSVASLAKDLAAECAKAYELMESSLSKLTNDFSIGPFGLTPKTKKKFRGPPAPPMK